MRRIGALVALFSCIFLPAHGARADSSGADGAGAYGSGADGAGTYGAGSHGVMARQGQMGPLRALILSGANNHDWRETTPVLRQILEESGSFTVDVLEQPGTMTRESIAHYNVIISNWNTRGEELTPAGLQGWPEEARMALIEFVHGGRGFVSVHAGSSSFYDWDTYQALVMATWEEGVTGHGPEHTFRVKPTREQHPITAGMEPFEIFDELWHKVPVQPGTRVLATAFSAVDQGGTGRDEPVLLARDFGRGRSANLLLGHSARAMQDPSFVGLFVRSVEWAASR